MARDPGSTFASIATSALDRARAQFEQDRWALGIEAASADALRAALDQAVRAAATTCSTSQDAVRAILPADRVESSLQQLARQQEAALRTARTYASSFSGMLARSIHVEEPTAGAYLRALASHHSADACISEPLSQLAEALTGWQALLECCSREVGADRALRSSYRRRIALRAAAVLLGAVTLAAAVIAASWWWLVAEAARKRLQASLDNADPCAIGASREADRRFATNRQSALWAEREKACAVKRERDRYVARCLGLAERVDSNQLTADDEAAAGGSAAVLKRVGSAGLIPDDLLIDPAAFPCADTPAQARLRSSFARRVAASSALWSQAEKVSEPVAQLLARPEYSLTADSQSQLAAHADAVSRKAIVVGAPAEMARAEALCGLQRKLNAGPPGRGCKALDRIKNR